MSYLAFCCVWRIEYFYELGRILTRPTGSSKYKQRVNIIGDTTELSVL